MLSHQLLHILSLVILIVTGTHEPREEETISISEGFFWGGVTGFHDLGAHNFTDDIHHIWEVLLLEKLLGCLSDLLFVGNQLMIEQAGGE